MKKVLILGLLFMAMPVEAAEILPHPAGCPKRLFCGCGAAVEVFNGVGTAYRALWKASAWFKFPHTSPAPGTVAVRRNHVFVLRSHIEGNTWLVADYNSGGHKSRLHERSIAGYTIVNPGRGVAAIEADHSQPSFH